MERGDLIADRYRLEELIGRGGMGEVWRATDLELHRTIAVKRGSGTNLEGRAGAKLTHPNVINLLTSFTDESGQEWLVMEYLPSRSLKAIRDKDGPLPPEQVAGIGAQIASALAHLHGKNMVHRDVSPANVLVTTDRIAKLTDFGIATWDSETHPEDAKTGGGTRDFQAPEVVRGHRATSASDIYSLGATLMTAVAGHPSPQAGRDAALGTLLATLTHQDPEHRPTAEQAQHRLANLATPHSRRSRWPAVTAVVLVVVLVGALVWVYTTRPSRNTPTAAAPAAPRSTTPRSPTSIMGDPHTADPCALTYANALAPYGEVETRNDYGEFNRCDALVYLTADHQDSVDVQVELVVHQQDSRVPVQRVGAIGLQRPPADPDGCGRTLLLPGDYQVSVYAQEHGNEKVDLCGMAEAVTSSALVTLNAGPIPRRTLPAASLATKNACALLDPATVTAAIGPALVPRPGFANWDCDWTGTDGSTPVKVEFDQNKAGVGETADGTPIRLAGYTGRVLPPDGSDPDCDVDLVYRTYTDSAGDRTDDVVQVRVYEGHQRCALARRLASTAARRLGHAN